MKVNRIMTALMAVTLLTMGACSNHPAALENIPADASMVARIDLEKASSQLEKAGFDPEEILAQSRQLKNITEIKDILGCIDTKNVIAFATGTSETTVIIGLKDADAFTDKVAKQIGRQPEESNGYKVFSDFGDYGTLAVSENYAWLLTRNADAAAAAGYVNSFIEKAQDNSAADVKAFAEPLSAENAFTAVINMAAFSGGAKGMPVEFVNIAVDLDKDADINFTARATDKENAPFEMPWYEDIDDDALAYVPANAVGAFAVGISPDMPWGKVFDAAGSQMSRSDAAIVGMVKPYFEALDGTVMLSVAPRGNMSPGDFAYNIAAGRIYNTDCIIMARLKEGAANPAKALANMLGTQLPANGLAEVPFPDSRGEGKLYMGNLDGYMAVATYKPQKGAVPACVKGFDGHEMGMFLNFPAGMFGPGIPAVSFEMSYDDNVTKGRVAAKELLNSLVKNL